MSQLTKIQIENCVEKCMPYSNFLKILSNFLSFYEKGWTWLIESILQYL